MVFVGGRGSLYNCNYSYELRFILSLEFGRSSH